MQALSKQASKTKASEIMIKKHVRHRKHCSVYAQSYYAIRAFCRVPSLPLPSTNSRRQSFHLSLESCQNYMEPIKAQSDLKMWLTPCKQREHMKIQLWVVFKMCGWQRSGDMEWETCFESSCFELKRKRAWGNQKALEMKPFVFHHFIVYPLLIRCLSKHAVTL